MNSKEQLSILEKVDSFKDKVGVIKAGKPGILQLNIIRKCNLFCKHCHVEASPNREEMMSKEILKKALELAKEDSITAIDITGGSPEMNPHLEWFLNEASKLKKRIIVRSNLVILKDEKFKKFSDIYAKNHIEICASVPSYIESKSDKMRGCGSFSDAIEVIKILNEKGYGKDRSDLILYLIHNPVGAHLPGSQKALEQEYKKELYDKYKIVFNNLFTITNMPLGRYLEYLIESGNFKEYMQELINAYNPKAAESVMCKNTLSVAYDGSLYDCDFNQMLCIPINGNSNIMNLNSDDLKDRDIILNNHCYGCTAGFGSSCQGSTQN